ncbi:MAG TPA: malate:quinone oxidoreductase, partial [Luteolibacter sp.]
FYPAAREEDWRLIDAGIRVQAIKKTDGEAGIVHYGTEVICSADRSISALLGASPGASVCVNIVSEVIKTCFPDLLASPEGKARMKAMLPTFDEDIKLPENAERFREVSRKAEDLLQLH